MENKRLQYIDFAKGLTILLVIFSHSLKFGDIPRAIIFSFHMPLFFICSGITSKAVVDKTQILKKIVGLSKKILLPVVCVFLIYLATDLFGNWSQNANFSFVKKKITSFIFALGQDETIKGIKIENIGMLWFLVAFFFAQVIYLLVRSYLKEKYHVPTILAIALLGFLIGKKILLPLDLDIAMVMTIFLLGGYLYKKYIDRHISNIVIIVTSILLWGTTFFVIYFLRNHYLIVSERSYPIFPISLLTAFAGTLVIIGIGKIICNIKGISVLNTIGIYSMRLFIIHSMDVYWECLYNLTNNRYINGIIRIGIDLIALVIITFVINRIRMLRNERTDQRTK